MHLPPSPCFLKSSQVKPITSLTLSPQPYTRDNKRRSRYSTLPLSTHERLGQSHLYPFPPHLIPELTADYEYLIVDGPASLSEATRAILFRSNLAFIPVQPTGVNLRSAYLLPCYLSNRLNQFGVDCPRQ